MAEIDTLFMTKTAENNTLRGRVYQYSLYKWMLEEAQVSCLIVFTF